MQIQRLALVTLALAGVSAGAGCGGGSGSSAPEIKQGRPTVPDAPVVAIDGTNFKFSVGVLRARPGENLTIALTSKEGTHDIVLDDGVLPVRISMASEGVTALGGLVAPQQPGTYAIYCSLIGHRSEGMEAQLVVAP